MEHTNENLITALFRNREDAENAYQELLDRGYTRDEINILMSEETRNRHYQQTEMGTKTAEGTAVGAVIGGAAGAIVAAVAAIGTSLILPGLGLIVAGPLAAALAGAGAGGATGGLVGALIGYGIPEEKIKHYEKSLKEGGMVIGFRPRNNNEAREVENVWRKYNGEITNY